MSPVKKCRVQNEECRMDVVGYLLMLLVGVVVGGSAGAALSVRLGYEAWTWYRKGIKGGARCVAGTFIRRVRKHPWKEEGTYILTDDQLEQIKREVEELDIE